MEYQEIYLEDLIHDEEEAIEAYRRWLSYNHDTKAARIVKKILADELRHLRILNKLVRMRKFIEK